MECPLCLEFYSDVRNDFFVTTFNGHIFHHSCITKWSLKEITCPTCRKCSILPADLIRLRTLDPNRSNSGSSSNVPEEFSPSAPPESSDLTSEIAGLSLASSSNSECCNSSGNCEADDEDLVKPSPCRHDYTINNTEVTLGKDNQVDGISGNKNKVIYYGAGSTIILSGNENTLLHYGERCDIIVTGSGNNVQLYRRENTLELKGDNNKGTIAGPNNTIINKGKGNKVKKY